MTTDERITKRRAQLTKARAAIPDDGQLPLSTTRDEAAVLAARRVTLDTEIRALEAAVTAHAALGPEVEADTHWRDHLVTWRTTLCAELMTITSPIRDKDTKDRADGLTFSIRLIDFGFAICTLGPLLSVTSLPLGQLMREAGYATDGPALQGPRGWRGSVPEVEARLKIGTVQRLAAQAALDAALLDETEQAKVDADSAELRAAFNTMNVTLNGDGRSLVAYRDDGSVLAVAEMTPIQRKAFERMEAAHRGSDGVVAG